jgi:thiosulfate/3-mercaptopyruvate sulfurtransferase
MRDRHMYGDASRTMLVRDVTQVAPRPSWAMHEIVDARSAARFRGEAPEPREGLRGGPHSRVEEPALTASF